MKKAFKLQLRILALIIMVIMSSCLCTYSSNLDSIEAIIGGKQDKLIFATIVSVGTRVSTVEVMEEIGEDTKPDDKDGEIPSGQNESILGKKIEIEGLHSYMYYDGFSHSPKIGDNVLLSLTFSGNTYRVKNGAFYVSAASHDTFNFIVPDIIDNTPQAMELTALYRFVGTNGKNADFTVKDSVVYTHDTAKGGVEIRIESQEGLTFVNEKGETTKETEPGILTGVDRSDSNPHRWIYASLVVAFGAVAGLFVVKMLIKMEKKSESK